MSGLNSVPSRPEQPLSLPTRAIKRGLHLLRVVLLRQAPHAILSWRYVLPNQGPEVHLHRKVFLRAWPEYPRAVWVLFALCSYLPWYFCRAWGQTLAAWRRHGSDIRDHHNISLRKQLGGVLALSIGHSTPPALYYLYRLYLIPESRWLHYVFTHELPQWHKVMSPNIGPRSRGLLSHKHAFASEMSDRGLPTVDTHLFLQKGAPIPVRNLFSGVTLFLKPENGSRMQGCFVLRSEHGRYRLEGAETAEGEEEILRVLQRQVNRQDYLAQPRLANHPLLKALCPSDALMTIRMVTVRGNLRGRILSAVLEVPIGGEIGAVIPLPIETGGGTVLRHAEGVAPSNLLPDWLGNLEGIRLPDWEAAVEVAETAHMAFSDVATIGWDLAITGEGVRLLEGNFNWSVAPHQLEWALPMKAWETFTGFGFEAQKS